MSAHRRPVPQHLAERIVRPAETSMRDALRAGAPFDNPAGYVILGIWRHPRAKDTEEPLRFIVADDAGAPFATFADAERAGAALEARGFINGGISPVVAITDGRLPA